MISIAFDASRALRKLDRLADAVRADVQDEAGSLIGELAARVADNLSGRVLNVRTGRLLAAMRSELQSSRDAVEADVSVDGGEAPYAKIHEYGGSTGAHEIAARAAAALAFSWRGRPVFFRRVQHPGSQIPERSYLRSALTDMRDDIVARLTKAAQDAAKGV